MEPPTLSLICDTNPMCYGSSTALLCVLDPLRDALRGRLQVTALVHGVTREVLASDAAVDSVLEVDVKAPADVEAALDGRHVDAALVVSNQSNIDVYRRLGIPLFFIDILYWYGQTKTGPVWEVAEEAFAQRFPGVSARAGRSTVPPTLVGPLLRNVPRTRNGRTGTLVALGGGRSRWIVPGRNSDYATRVADWVVDLPSLPEPITLAGGLEAIASIPMVHSVRQRATLVTLPHRTYLARLASTALLLTAPGLNAVFEGLYSGVPIVTLPPQNASQVAQLQRYEEAGVFPEGLNLPALDPHFPPYWADLPEVTQTERVLESLGRLASPERHARIVQRLAEQIDSLPSRRQQVRDFVAGLGPPGGGHVALAMADWWRMRWM